jgi:hypoxanthine-guanine phosphoribosyltransferase
LKIGYLIDKPFSRRISINADYAAFVLDSAESGYLVGCGLGRDNSFRHLSYLGILEKDART